MDTYDEAKAVIERVVTAVLAGDDGTAAHLIRDLDPDAQPFVRAAAGMVGAYFTVMAEERGVTPSALWARQRGAGARPVSDFGADFEDFVARGRAQQAVDEIVATAAGPAPQVGQYALSLTRQIETDPLGGIVVDVDDERQLCAVRWCWGGAFQFRRYVIPFADLDPSTSFVDAPSKTVRSIIVGLCRTIASIGRNARFTEEHRQMLDDVHALVARAS